MVHSVESQSTPYQSTPHVTVYFVRSKQVLSLDIRLVSIQVYSLWGKGGRSIKRGGDYMLSVGMPPSILSLTEWTANVNCKKLALSINLHSPSCDLPKCDVFICICVCVKNGALKRARFCPTQSGQQRRKGELISVEYPKGQEQFYVLCPLSLHLFLTSTLWGRHCNHHFRDGEPKSQRCEMTCPRSYSSGTEKLELKCSFKSTTPLVWDSTYSPLTLSTTTWPTSGAWGYTVQVMARKGSFKSTKILLAGSWRIKTLSVLSAAICLS